MRCCFEPIKLFSCLNVFGEASFSMFSAFLKVVVPSLRIMFALLKQILLFARCCLIAVLYSSFDVCF